MTNSAFGQATADLNDAHPGKLRLAQQQFTNYGAKRCFSGCVHTAVAVEDTKLVQEKLFTLQGNGGVIVLDGGGSLRTAMLGDMMAERLITNGWSGIVINGAVRDSQRLAQLDLGIKALGTSPVRPAKTGAGAIDVPVAFGGVLFEPGSHIYCDDDGILLAQEPL